MRRLELGGREVNGARRSASTHAFNVAIAVALAATLAAVSPTPATAADEVSLRFEAPIVVEQPGAFVRLPLPVSAYTQARQASLADLRIVDARGERVPFALLAPPAEQVHAREATRPAALYLLPPRRPGQAEPGLPIEVQVVGDRITVRRAAPAAAPRAGAAGATSAAAPAPGWLIDLGDPKERASDEPPAHKLRLAWAANTPPFTAAYELALSDDLRQWRAGGGGQLLALDAAGARLAQSEVPLAAGRTAGAGRETRFVRLRWLDAASAPVLTAATQVFARPERVRPEPPVAFEVPPIAAGAPDDAKGALTYDLGAVLPLADIDLALGDAARVAPVRVQGRSRIDEPWRDLAQTVFYRLERGGTFDRPPPLSLPVRVRYLRLVPDLRSGPLPAVPLAVRAPLASVVFAAQGTPPYRLQAGSADAPAGALPITTLVPALEQERARLGHATLGAWRENEAVARAEAWRQRWTEWRPALLWAVLLAGVAALAWMVWRLARSPTRSG